MIIINQIFDWHWINLATPFLGIIGCGWMFYSHKTCTKRKAISTAVSLSIMLWLMLIWADWGSSQFVPSYQSMWARTLLIAISALIPYELRRHTMVNRRLVANNIVLRREIGELEDENRQLQSRLAVYQEYSRSINTTNLEESKNVKDIDR